MPTRRGRPWRDLAALPALDERVGQPGIELRSPHIAQLGERRRDRRAPGGTDGPRSSRRTRPRPRARAPRAGSRRPRGDAGSRCRPSARGGGARAGDRGQEVVEALDQPCARNRVRAGSGRTPPPSADRACEARTLRRRSCRRRAANRRAGAPSSRSPVQPRLGESLRETRSPGPSGREGTDPGPRARPRR